MHTLKKFIPYYSPYKAVFVLDLICAAMISLIDLAYPQILRTMTKTVFAGKSSAILQVLLPIGVAMLIMYIVQALCKYYVSYQKGHMMGANMELGYAAKSNFFARLLKNYLFRITIRTIPDR